MDLLYYFVLPIYRAMWHGIPIATAEHAMTDKAQERAPTAADEDDSS